MFQKINPECKCEHEWATLRETKKIVTREGKPIITKELNKTTKRTPIHSREEIITREIYCRKCGIMKVKVIQNKLI